MEPEFSEIKTFLSTNEPETSSYVSYTGSFWNEIKKDTDFEVFEIFEVLSFNYDKLLPHHDLFRQINCPAIADCAIYNYLLGKTKELLYLSDEEAFLIWNWGVGQIMNDGFFLFFEQCQYNFFATPNYYNTEERRSEQAAFKSLLTKLRNHPAYVSKVNHVSSSSGPKKEMVSP